VIGVASLSPAAPPAAGDTWKPDWLKLSGELRSGYDFNVFLQDVGDLRRRGSLVTTSELSFAAEAKRDEWSGLVSYVPAYTVFSDESSEDNWRHTFRGDFSFTHDRVTFKTVNKVTLIDGSNLGPTFLGPGGAPAIGGVAIRERRDALVLNSRASLQFDLDEGWFARPVVSYYDHDFHTQQRTDPGYQNYVDRNDLNAGADVGRTLGNGATKTAVFVGYRFGHQYEDDLLASTTDYSNEYHRVLVGVDGTPRKGITLNVLAGLDYRSFGPHILPGADSAMIVPWAEVTAKWAVTDDDTLTLSVISFMQPGFSGRSVYQDSIYQLAYARKLNSEWTATASAKAWNADFAPPALRNDWLYTLSAGVEWTPRKGVTVGATATYEWSDSRVPATPAREFERTYVGVFGRIAL
jgi:hypothetical protein